MTQARTPPVGWGAFLLLATVAAALPPGGQLGFAALALGLLGLPHGAGDLAVVAPDRRRAFLVVYVGTITLVLVLWLVAPAVGLCALLVGSAVHFATDDAEPGGHVRDWATGICLVAGPAALHRDGIAMLFVDVSGADAFSQEIASALQPVGIVALAVAAWAAVRDRRRREQHGATLPALAATALLPPLVGFAAGFVLLHARGQTERRRRELGCATTGDYLRLVAPVMAAATIVLLGTALVFAHRPAGDSVTLFAAIAALATPHMLVTPWFRRDARASPPASLPGRASLHGGA